MEEIWEAREETPRRISALRVAILGNPNPNGENKGSYDVRCRDRYHPAKLEEIMFTVILAEGYTVPTMSSSNLHLKLPLVFDQYGMEACEWIPDG